MKTCLKCGFENSSQTLDPLSACPKCGAIYARVEAARAPKVAQPPEVNQGPKVSRTFSVAHLVAVAAIALVLGYFLGREHLKSQMLSVFAAAAGEMSRALSPTESVAPTPPPPPPPPRRNAPTSPLNIQLTGKGFRPDRDTNGRVQMEAVTFDVTFFNSTSKAIRAFDGTIKFVDLLGNEIIAARVEINEEVPALGQLTWSGGLDYNKYMNPHQRMRSEPIESLRVLFAPGKVLYSDGKLVKFEE